jgi:hypothetical protein
MNLEPLVAGDSKIIAVTVRDEAGVVVDITDATAIAWQVKRTAGDAVPLVDKALASGVAITGGQAGVFEVTLDPDDTKDLEPGLYCYAARIVLGAVEATVVSGYMLLRASLVTELPV